MGTEVAISFTALRAQLETERSSLYKIDENIKKIVQTTGRFSNDRFNNSGDYTKGGPRLGGRNTYPDSRQNDDSFGKRKQETKTVFSRLSARTDADSDGEEEGGGKRARVESAVWRELPSRAAVLRAQGGDEQARTRNRRIFGSLLGTLHKFKQEEIVLQTKEDKKAQVERKIEEQARVQKEKEQKERKTLFAEREHKKATIKALEAKMARVQEFDKWEASQKNLADFILTRAKPHIYWIPKKMTDKATEKLNSSRKYHEKCMGKKRAELQEELRRIEQRCLRVRAPAAPRAPAKENEPAPASAARARDKFAVGADARDDSDADDQPDPRRGHECDSKRGDEHDVKRGDECDDRHGDGRDDRHGDKRDVEHNEEPDVQHGDGRDVQHGDEPDVQHGDERDVEHSDKRDVEHNDEPDVQHGDERDVQHGDKRDTQQGDEPADADTTPVPKKSVTDGSKIDISTEQNTTVEVEEAKNDSHMSVDTSDIQAPAEHPPAPAPQA